ncbi:hypothetical protein [Vibrio quintilis]|uniref:Uncharacterized protein n=1 Tax=Vibrio quintilis TaxID=1117707 RepID=A0A1M7YYD2_9VIBR|nr:hypothetical protein [Vibrio quintilis]SHO57572.1 hypothetical protein VQ7734_03342 [Vibrio quintilis]
MNNFKALFLATPLILLNGCGSESSGSAPVSKYNLQFVSLKVLDEDEVNSNCEIYGRKEIYDTSSDSSSDDSSSDEPDSVNVVVAQKSTGSLLTAYIQDNTGAVTATYNTATSSNWSSDGKLTIVASDVPANGYVTITRKLPGSTTTYALTLQKSFLQTNMTINTVLSEVTAETCVTGSSESKIYERTGSIDQDGDGFGIFGFSTLEGIFQGFSGQSIEMESPSSTFLATRHVRESDDSAGEIKGYRFITLGQVSEDSAIELKTADSGDMTGDISWVAPQDMSLTAKAEMNVYKSGTGALHWQYLPQTGTGTYGYASAVGGSNYYVSTQGTYNQWTVNETQAISSPANGLDLSTALSAKTLPAVATSELVSCSTSAVGSCLQTYSDLGASLTAQRTYVSINNGSGTEVKQVIYSTPQALVPMLSFNDSDLDNLWSNSLSVSEVSLLMGTTSSEVKDIFTRQYFDSFAVAENTFDNGNKFTDSISIATPLGDKKENENYLKRTNNLQLQYHETK